MCLFLGLSGMCIYSKYLLYVASYSVKSGPIDGKFRKFRLLRRRVFKFRKISNYKIWEFRHFGGRFYDVNVGDLPLQGLRL